MKFVFLGSGPIAERCLRWAIFDGSSEHGHQMLRNFLDMMKVPA